MASPNPPIPRFRLLVALVGVCILGLVAGIVLVSIENARTSARLDALEQYVAGKGAERDVENARLRELQRQGMCDLLDTFPSSDGQLGRARHKYGCGPGLAPADLTPQEQVPIQTGESPRTPALPTPTKTPTPTGPAPAPAAPATPTAAPAPTSAPAPPSPVCALLPLVCARSLP